MFCFSYRYNSKSNTQVKDYLESHLKQKFGTTYSPKCLRGVCNAAMASIEGTHVFLELVIKRETQILQELEEIVE